MRVEAKLVNNVLAIKSCDVNAALCVRLHAKWWEMDSWAKNLKG